MSLGRFTTTRATQAQTGRLLAEVTSIDQLSQVQPALTDLPPGSKGRVVIQGTGIGLLADLAGMEQLWQRKMPSEIKIVDVYGNGLSEAVVNWEVMPTMGQGITLSIGVGPFIIAIGVALMALGWAIHKIIVWLDSLGGGGFPFVPLLIIGALVIGAGTLARVKRKAS